MKKIARRKKNEKLRKSEKRIKSGDENN